MQAISIAAFRGDSFLHTKQQAAWLHIKERRKLFLRMKRRRFVAFWRSSAMAPDVNAYAATGRQARSSPPFEKNPAVAETIRTKGAAIAKAMTASEDKRTNPAKKSASATPFIAGCIGADDAAFMFDFCTTETTPTRLCKAIKSKCGPAVHRPAHLMRKGFRRNSLISVHKPC